MNALAFASSWPPGFFEVTGLYSGSADDDALADDEDALVELEHEPYKCELIGLKGGVWATSPGFNVRCVD